MTSSTSVLVVGAEESLTADLRRLAAAAGLTPMAAETHGEALRAWSVADVVLVCADLAGDVAGIGPPRREHVYIVARMSDDEYYRAAIACGASNVVLLPRDEDWLMQMLVDVADGSPTRARSVGVIGGVGGAGVTTFAAALALTCSRTGPTALFDADPLGAGVDQVVGRGLGDGVRWDGLVQATGRLSARSVREALPRCDGLGVVAWPVERRPMVSPSVGRELFSAVCRGHEVVVVDLPRHHEPLATELMPRCDLLLLVTPATVPGAAAAARVLANLPSQKTRLVVRGGRGCLRPDDVEAFLGLPIAAVMSPQRGLDEDVGLGVGPLRNGRGPLARAAVEVAALVRRDPRERAA